MKAIIKQIKNSPFKSTFGITCFILGSMGFSPLFYFLFGYAFGDIMFNEPYENEQ
jgi:hypothetical protein